MHYTRKKHHKIRTIRRLFQLSFTVFTALIFTVNLPAPIYNFYNALHVLPAISVIVSDRIINGFIFISIFILLLPFISGRLYCSYLCPIGFFQDISLRLSGYLKPRIKPVSGKSPFRLFILFSCLLLILSGSSIYGYIDHYSNLNRISYSLISPLLNKVISLSDPLQNYLSGTDRKIMLSPSGYYSLLFLLILFFTALFRPRWFCNTLCPSGTLFSLIQRYAFFKISGRKKCSSCSSCTISCPAKCIESGSVNTNCCIYCFECLEFCPEQSFRLSIDKRHPVKNNRRIHRDERRRFIKNIISLGAAMGFSVFMKTSQTGARTVSKTILPPGAGIFSRFKDKCTGCGLCSSACPTGVIVPSFLENGLSGIFKPMLDYNRSYCSYDCNKCMTVCPANALQYYDLEQKQKIKIAEAVLNKKLCISYKNGWHCGLCAGVCPTKAIISAELPKILVPVPVLRKEYCIGCGACQHICPVEPVKAVIAVTVPYHTAAETLL